MNNFLFALKNNSNEQDGKEPIIFVYCTHMQKSLIPKAPTDIATKPLSHADKRGTRECYTSCLTMIDTPNPWVMKIWVRGLRKYVGETLSIVWAFEVQLKDISRIQQQVILCCSTRRTSIIFDIFFTSTQRLPKMTVFSQPCTWLWRNNICY